VDVERTPISDRGEAGTDRENGKWQVKDPVVNPGRSERWSS